MALRFSSGLCLPSFSLASSSSPLLSRNAIRLLRCSVETNAQSLDAHKMIIMGLFKGFLVVSNIVSLCSSPIGGNLELAELILRQVGDATPFVWNTVIRGYERSHKSWKAIHLYHKMLCNLVSADKFTFPFVLKACANVCALKEGEQIHCQILKSPYILDMFVQGSLVYMYCKCGKIEAARVSFDTMPYKNLTCWNTMIDGYVKHGDIVAARKLFDQIPERDMFSWNVMIDGCAKCGQVDTARKLFDEMPSRDIVSWNSIIDGYAKYGNMGAAKELFDVMPLKDVVTWGIMLNGYAKCGQIGIAHVWFEKLPYKSLITWNSLVQGYSKCGNIRIARKLFDLMPSRNSTTWNLMLDAYTKCGDIETAWQLFKRMPMKDVVSWNIMIDGHARVGSIMSAKELFDIMPCRDVVSWNTMIVGYKQIGLPKKAIELFNDMQMIGEKPDSSTMAAVLSAIADLGLIVQGRWVHAYIERAKCPLDGIIGVALIDMYSKCGYVDSALGIFSRISQKTKDHWNSMISGVAIHGHGSLAVSIFEEMEQSMIVPDDITFISLLNACSHAGLVHEGLSYFQLMNHKYGITPKIQHYGCMVDLLSRAGNLQAAITLVRNMPIAPNDILWRALLGASRNHGDIEIAEQSAKFLIGLMPYDSSSYVLLSNIYESIGLCKSARDVWKMMKEKGVVKTPGCSSIELHGVVHEFTVGVISHPEMVEVHLLLNKMVQGLILAGNVPDVKSLLFDTDV